MKQVNEGNDMKSRILIVDDEEAIRDTLKIILSDAGYAVETASDGQIAIALLKKMTFDVAVVDRILPECMSGIEVISEIKKYNPLCETLLMSAYPSFESAAKTMEHETMAYLTKPIQQDEICRVVKIAAQKNLIKRETERNESILRGLFNASPNPIIIYDSHSTIKFVNSAFTSLTGYGRDEVFGRKYLLVPEADSALVAAEFQSIIAGDEVKEREQAMLCKDGRLVPCSRIVSLCECLQTSDADILIIIRDISEEKKMQDQILQSEKLSLLGQLAAKLAHEINNPLQIITGQSELLLRESFSDETRQQLFIIQEASRRIERLNRHLMDVAKPKLQSIERFPPEQPLEKAADFLLSMGQTKYIAVVRQYNAHGTCIQGDPNQIEQVFMNLITNASQAMAESQDQVLTLSTTVDQEHGMIHIAVADTGCGIDSQLKSKIFDPFFTTKENGAGYGLGLTVVKQIVDRHAGSIAVTSGPGSGTAFTVSLPCYQAHEQITAPVVGPGWSEPGAPAAVFKGGTA